MPPVKRQIPKPRTKSTDNTRVVELRKERSRDAARNRRGKENAQFDELAKLLPLPAAITSQLDKASIVRLTISYLSMREFSGTVPQQRQISDAPFTSESSLSPISESSPGATCTSPLSSVSSAASPSFNAVVPFSKFTHDPIPQETGSQLLQALEGFLVVLSQEGKILYVSETVSVNLGLSQVELTGSNIYQYVHPEDHHDLALQLKQTSAEEDGSPFPNCQQSEDNIPFLNQQGTPVEQPTSLFLRMKCTLVRRGGSYTKSSGFKVINCVGRMKKYATDLSGPARKAFVMVAQPVLTMNINELPLECNMFVSRVNMDLKIVYCEGRIHKFMDYLAKDIVGISAYDFYHAGDVAVIQGHHAKFLSKGQVWTKYYRWMNKNGGWVWMQTKASLIPHPSNPELKQMLCLNYILSDVEHRSIVLGMAQLNYKPQLTSASNTLTEVPSEVDNTGLLKDALIDDQVMVFPKWHATSDKLVPEQTLLDQLALERTGYNAPHEEFPSWQQPKGSSIAATVSDTELDVDENELEDIAEIINAEMTDFDRKLLDFVVSGGNPTFQTTPSQLGPLGAYIEEIPQTNQLAAINRSGIVVPKIEDISVDDVDFTGSNSCFQFGDTSRQTATFTDGSTGSGGVPQFAKPCETIRTDGPAKRHATRPFTYGDTIISDTIPSKIPRLSHMRDARSGQVSESKLARRMATVTSSTMTASSGQNSARVQGINVQSPATNSNTPSSMVISITGQYPTSSQDRGNARLPMQATATSTTPSSLTSSQRLGQFGVGVETTLCGQATPSSQVTYTSGRVNLSRKPQSLLEQLVRMPSTGMEEDDALSEDLMFELFDELLDEDYFNTENKSSVGLELGQCSSTPSSTNTSDFKIPIPPQDIKQEVITPTTLEASTPFTECFKPQFKTSARVTDLLPNPTSSAAGRVPSVLDMVYAVSQSGLGMPSNECQPDTSSMGQQTQDNKLNNVNMNAYNSSDGWVTMSAMPPKQLPKQNLQQLPQQQQQQLQQSSQQYPKQLSNQYQQPQQSPLLYQQQQVTASQYQLQREQHPQQQEHQRIQQELFNLIQRSSNAGFGGRQGVPVLNISSAPLPDLGNGLNEELNMLPLSQSATIASQNLNSGTVSRGEQPPPQINNFSGPKSSKPKSMHLDSPDCKTAVKCKKKWREAVTKWIFKVENALEEDR